MKKPNESRALEPVFREGDSNVIDMADYTPSAYPDDEYVEYTDEVYAAPVYNGEKLLETERIISQMPMVLDEFHANSKRMLSLLRGVRLSLNLAEALAEELNSEA